MSTLQPLHISDVFLLFMHRAASYLPVVAALLVAFLTASHADLKYWIALQGVPTPHQASEAQAEKPSTFRGVSLLPVIYVTVGSLSAAFFESLKLNAFFMVPIFWLFSCLFLDYFLGFFSMTAHRDMKGVPTAHIAHVDTTVACMAGASSMLAVLYALLVPDSLSSIFVLAAMATATSRARCKKTMKLAHYFCFNMILWTLVVGIVGIICRLVYVRFAEHFTIGKMEAIFTDPEFQMWMNSYWASNWLIVPLLVVAIGAPLGTLLRFDYHLASAFQNRIDSIELFVPVGHPTEDPKLRPGVVIPRRFAAKFPKIYFNTALKAWLSTQIGLIILCSLLATESAYLMPRLPFVILSTCCSVFNIPAAVFFVAWRRGDFKELWSYEEIWVAGGSKSMACDLAQDLEKVE